MWVRELDRRLTTIIASHRSNIHAMDIRKSGRGHREIRFIIIRCTCCPTRRRCKHGRDDGGPQFKSIRQFEIVQHRGCTSGFPADTTSSIWTFGTGSGSQARVLASRHSKRIGCLQQAKEFRGGRCPHRPSSSASAGDGWRGTREKDSFGSNGWATFEPTSRRVWAWSSWIQG